MCTTVTLAVERVKGALGHDETPPAPAREGPGQGALWLLIQ
ncbi:MAG: hypothetical protein ACRDQ0_00510 [Pseudonocardia sp.]